MNTTFIFRNGNNVNLRVNNGICWRKLNERHGRRNNNNNDNDNIVKSE